MTLAYQIACCKCPSCGHVFIEKLPNTIPTSVARCPKCGDIAEVDRIIPMERCQRCGSTKNLVVHHKDGVHGALFPDEVVVLCRRCHAIVHLSKREKVKEYFVPLEKWLEKAKQLRRKK